MNFDAVIDSYAWIEYFIGSSEGKIVKEYVESKKSATPTIVIAELAAKYFREGWQDIWKQDYKFIRTKTTLCELTPEIAEAAGKHRDELKRDREGFGLADAIIYETAKALKARLVTGDEHFQGLANVIFIR